MLLISYCVKVINCVYIHSCICIGKDSIYTIWYYPQSQVSTGDLETYSPMHNGGLLYVLYKELYRIQVMTNLDSILKSRDTTLLTKIHIVKAITFLVVMYGCESWTIKKAER